MEALRVETVDDPVKAGIAHAIALDFPRNAQLVSSQEVVLVGWMLGIGEYSKPPVITIEVDGKATAIPLNISRIDVISRILRKNTDDRIRCGFKVTVPLCKEILLYTENDRRKILWKRIAVQAADSDFLSEEFRELSILFSHAGQERIGTMTDCLSRLKGRSIADLTTILSRECNVTGFFAAAKAIPSEEREQIAVFLDRIINGNTLGEWIRTGNTENRFVLPNAFGPGEAQSSFSIYTDTRINLLFFSSASEPFVILQHVTYADAVFFPNRHLVILLQHLSASDVFKSLAEAAHWLLSSSPPPPKDRVFGGGIAGFGRPYHFFYDIAPALQSLQENGLLKDIPFIFHGPGSMFVDPADVFTDPAPLKMVLPADLRKQSLDNGEFHCRLGLPFEHLSEEINERLDASMREAAARKYPSIVRKKNETTNRGMRIWWGITGQKRSWAEQEEGTAFVLDQLAASYPELEVVFDGWTSPIDSDPGPENEREIQNDKAVVRRIMERLKHRIRTSSIIGKSSLEKVAVSTTCNAFVANYSTGSMHVSRFGARPGVLHINTKLAKQQHIQHRAVTVPAERTKDLPAADDQRADFISYSIDPADILFLLRSVIETSNN